MCYGICLTILTFSPLAATVAHRHGALSLNGSKATIEEVPIIIKEQIAPGHMAKELIRPQDHSAFRRDTTYISRYVSYRSDASFQYTC